ncbi:hypothetical protein CNYM01_13883 [Colletotrichum nymphaeae SA-01]|uniref:F-box domain-containing protein n=1 Tax=Colletotrichum nymphaeae SA-01 TaxID=1460502 RepID=A0A135U9S6_9PEZI|nr:hypothetical protein CNYM01_13883 [Colletotrichum nymphaeae SA-01]
MASISSLPPEMLGEIAACFQDDSPLDAYNDWTADQKTLAILSRISKSFQYAAQPLLYRKIYLAVRDPVGLDILSLIKVLYHRQDLRSKVDEVQIHFEQAYSCHLKRTTEDVQNLHRLAENIGQTNLCHTLQGNTNDPWIYNNVLSSLLFNQLQGVSQVMITGLDGPDMKGDYGEFDHFENAWSVLPYLLIAPSETPEALLPNLAFLRLDAHVITITGLSEFHLLARLAPNLEEFEGWGFESIPVEAFNTFKRLKRLSLSEAPFVDSDFPNQGEFLQIPPGLHSFHYSTRFSCFTDELNISPMRVRRALAHHSDTLIDIGVQCRLDIKMGENDWFDTFGMFQKLEHLAVDPADFDMSYQNGSGPNAFITTLPRSLRSLAFLAQHHLNYTDIEWLANAVQEGDFENLESFTIRVNESDMEICYTTMGEIWDGIDKPESGEDVASFCVQVVSETDSRELWCYW